MDEITLPRAEYDRLVRERDDATAALKSTQDDLAASRTSTTEAEKELEAAETAKVAAEAKVATLETEVAAASKIASEAKLRDERLQELSAALTTKLGEKTRARLRTQAADMPDEEWASRIEELEEMTGVKRDAAAPAGSDKEFTHAETAAFKGLGSNGGLDISKNPEARRSVVGALLK